MSIYYCESLPHGVQRNGNKLNTRTHAEYITRQGEYEHMRNREEDLVYCTSGNMPDWAIDELDFWQAAEDNRRINGRAYREIRLGLQEELSLEDNLKCVEEFLKETGIADKHAYTYAVHDKTAMFADDHRNIHVHIMFSEKTIDKNRKLDKNTYFARYNVLKNGAVSGGYQVNPFWNDRNSLPIIRKQWADIVNNRFEKLNMDIRVSEKTLKEQRAELIKNGQYEEAELLDREPAPQLGDSVKNPKKRALIRSMGNLIAADVDEATSTTDDSGEFIEPAEKNMVGTEIFKTEEEFKMAIFAHDMLIRRLAKEIQQERAKERAKKEAEYTAKADEMEAVIITVGDVMAKAEERMAAFSDSISKTNKQIEQVKHSYTPKKDILRMAYSHATKGRYEALAKTVYEFQKQINEQRKLYAKMDKAFREYDASVFNGQLYHLSKARIKLLKEQQRPYVEALSKLRQETHKNGALSFEFEAVKKHFTNQNTAVEKEIASLSKTVSYKRSQYAKIYKKMEQLFDDDPNRILYADRLPTTVSIYNKLDGVIPLKDNLNLSRNIQYIDTGVKEREQYISITNTETENIEAIEKMYKENKKPVSILAVRIGDPIVQGQADIYRVEVVPTESKDGRKYLQVKNVYRTPKRQLLVQVRDYSKRYKVLAQKINGQKNKTAAHRATVSGHMTPKANQSISNMFSKVMDDRVPVGPQMHIVEEEDQDKEKTEMERVEERVKGGWSL